MAKANIKIVNISEGDVRTLVDKKIEVVIKNNTYFFTIDNFAQEIIVQENKIQIIRPEMTIDLKLDQTTECIYKHEENELKMNFVLNKINQKKDDLQFNYSLVDDQQKEINNINVEIKF